MPKTDANGNWINPRGKAIPPDLIRPEVKRREQVIDATINDGLRLHEQMRKTKERIIARLLKYDAYMESRTRVKRNQKGNLCLTSFSGEHQVEFRITDVIDFTDLLDHARELIYECIDRWSAGSNQNLRVVVDQAFGTEKKNYDKSRVLGLRQLNIKDPDWQRAMDMITDSVQIKGTSQYLRLRKREGESKFQNINLNFSSIET